MGRLRGARPGPKYVQPMDLRTMAVVTAAITVERLSTAGEHVARAIGAVVIVAAWSGSCG
jgi:hypothetical protein